MKLCDCVSKNSSETELLLVYSETAYATAKIARNRMTQAVLLIDPPYILAEELADVLDNDATRMW